MKPPKRDKTMTDFEKVTTDDFVTGIIEEVNYDLEHTFKGFQGKPDTKKPGVRFKFKLDGYNFPHYSRWMKFTLGEKSNLYIKYVQVLVENAQPDDDLDLDQFIGFKVKMLWKNSGDFQNIETIRPLEGKLKPLNNEDKVPF